jgi:peptidoglycan/xylan/chitin deacetylase (PgdA/CDA1 family)
MSLPTVALTFDDGPSKWTAPILDLLAEARARATFFVIGIYVRENADLLQRMVAEHHEIGIHGWNHQTIIDMPNGELRGQIMLTREAIRIACGYEPRRWRSPWGKMTDPAREQIQQTGLRIVGVGMNAFDCDRQSADIVKTVVPNLRDEMVVCLHDGVAPNAKDPERTRAETVKALPAILDACRSITVSELLS